MRTQTELGRSLDQARRHTDELFRLVHADALYERPLAERHRIVFYLGHLEAFDWNLIGRYALDLRPFHSEFDRLFAFGIDPPPGELPSDQPADWPKVAEVEQYNRRVRDSLDSVLEHVPERLLHVALEHRWMHAETFAYILHSLAYDKKAAPATPPYPAAPAPVARMIDIPAGTARLGLGRHDGFGWDNEFQEHHVGVPAFSVSMYKVTNGEYLEFVRAGADAPFFWTGDSSRRHYRGVFSEVPLPLHSPVYVTQQEAQAYAAWRGARLATEPEFHRAAGSAPPEPGGNFDFRFWDPVPVTASDDGQPSAPRQLSGNGWEWTSTPFGPFPGFEPFPFYQNYSEPFFDGRHYVLKGASPRTAACFLRPSFRNWFRPSYPYVYATFRLVKA